MPEKIEDLRPEKIAVLRANAVGDYIFAVPALEALRTRFPNAEIVLLGKSWHREFLTGRTGPIDRVIVVPSCAGVTTAPETSDDPQEQTEFFARMRQERFDVAIQLHGGGRYSNPFVRRLDAGLTVGLKTDDAAPLDRWIPYVYYQPEVARYLEVVGLLGASSCQPVPRVALTERDLAEFEGLGLPRDRPIIALHPGANDPRRRWPAASFATVGDALSDMGAVVVTGAPEERPLISEVLEGMKSRAIDLCGRLSLDGLAGLLSRAALVVSNDTGPLHLAASVGAPTVGIYWCGNVINGAPMTRGRHRIAISWQVECPACGRKTTEPRCEHNDSFVAEVSTGEVTALAIELLSNS